jgi:hypothetical protein
LLGHRRQCVKVIRQPNNRRRNADDRLATMPIEVSRQGQVATGTAQENTGDGPEIVVKMRVGVTG